MKKLKFLFSLTIILICSNITAADGSKIEKLRPLINRLATLKEEEKQAPQKAVWFNHNFLEFLTLGEQCIEIIQSMPWREQFENRNLVSHFYSIVPKLPEAGSFEIRAIMVDAGKIKLKDL